MKGGRHGPPFIISAAGNAGRSPLAGGERADRRQPRRASTLFRIRLINAAKRDHRMAAEVGELGETPRTKKALSRVAVRGEYRG